MYEIERKFLPKYDITKIISNLKPSHIEDYYVNDRLRIRKFDNYHILTFKKGIGVKRIEVEIQISKDMYEAIKEGLPLRKSRYFYKYKEHCFEINIFEDIKINNNSLIIIELPLFNELQNIELPEWIGEEITNDTNYYGYNLFKRISNGINE